MHQRESDKKSGYDKCARNIFATSPVKSTVINAAKEYLQITQRTILPYVFYYFFPVSRLLLFSHVDLETSKLRRESARNLDKLKRRRSLSNSFPVSQSRAKSFWVEKIRLRMEMVRLAVRHCINEITSRNFGK